MPAKLDRCVRKVQASGKSKSSAYGICSASTGIKRAKGGKWVQGKRTTAKRRR